MRLGEKLLHDRRITPEQLEAALRAQVMYGARLGTNLVELGLLDLDTLARVLGELAGVPAALQANFEEVDPAVLGLVPVRVAERHRAVPLGLSRLSGPQLVVALMDPADPAARGELETVTGARVVACVAPELRIHYYLERHYGIPRRTRFLRIGGPGLGETAASAADRRRYVLVSTISTSPVAGSSSTGSILDGSAEAATLPVHAPGTVTAASLPSLEGTARARPPAHGGTGPTSAPEGRAPAPRTVVPFPGPHVPARSSAAPPAAPFEPEHAAASPASTATLPVPPPRPALRARDAVERIVAAASRDEIGDTVVDFLRSAFACGLVLIARDGLALGWKGFTPGSDATAVEAVAVPLAAPSFLRAAHDAQGPFRGAPPAEGAAIQGRLWKLLRTSAPLEVMVVPVVLRDRPVLLVYAHGFSTIPDASAADLVAVCAAAATAFARLIQSTKQRSPDGG